MSLYLMLAAGFVLLLAGGELLVRGSVALAERLGMSSLLIGVVLVGFGTSMPEMVTSVEASLAGSPGIAVGNIVGSNLANTLLVLGLSALIVPIAIAPIVATRDGMFVLAATLVFVAIGYLASLDRIAGTALLLGLVFYIWTTYRQEKASFASDALAKKEANKDFDGKALSGEVGALAVRSQSALPIGMALAGAPDAGMATMMMGQQVALGNFLAYSRTQESVADASGARYLSMAGITGKGSVNFFKKLQSYEFRLGRTTENSYATTHPMSGERASVLEDTYRADPAWDAPLNPEWEAGFVLVKAKLRGFIQDPNKTLAQYPASDTRPSAHYARAYAYHKWKFVDKAEAEARALIAIDPANPYYHELLGQILLESGKPAEALEPLRMATQLSGKHPLIATLFGFALIATEDPAMLPEAESVLRASVAIDGENPDAWKQLGIIYTGKGDMPRAALAGAEHHILRGNPALALRDADAAMAGLPEYSADWIRAQDIKLTAENQIRAARDNERRNR